MNFCCVSLLRCCQPVRTGNEIVVRQGRWSMLNGPIRLLHHVNNCHCTVSSRHFAILYCVMHKCHRVVFDSVECAVPSSVPWISELQILWKSAIPIDRGKQGHLSIRVCLCRTYTTIVRPYHLRLSIALLQPMFLYRSAKWIPFGSLAALLSSATFLQPFSDLFIPCLGQ
jgi:hypothetical protein